MYSSSGCSRRSSPTAHLDKEATRLTIMGDSTCTIAATQFNVQGMKPFFANRNLEVATHLKSMGTGIDREVTEELAFLKWQPTSRAWEPASTERLPRSLPGTRGAASRQTLRLTSSTAGIANPADMPSRGMSRRWTWTPHTRLASASLDSQDQHATWESILTRDFLKQLPQEETRTQFHNIMLLKVEDITHKGYKLLAKVMD